MSNASQSRNRWMIPAPKPPLRKAIEFMARTDVWARIGLCVLTTTILYVVMFGWDPPFSYRVRQAPIRDVHANTSFLYEDYKATVEKRDRERRNFLCFYGNDQLPLEQLRQALIDDVFEIKQKEFAEIEKSNVWSKFFPADANNNPQTAADEESFNLFREAIVADEKLDVLRKAVEKAFLEIDKTGLLETLTHKIGDGSMEEIEVYPKGNLDDRTRVKVSDVRIAEVTDDLRKRLIDEFRNESDTFTDPELVAKRIFKWLKPQLPVTLSWDETSSKAGAENAVLAVGVLKKTINPGDQLEQQNSLNLDLRGIKAGVPLDAEDIRLLRAEHLALIDSEGLGPKLIRSCMFFGLFAAVFSMVCQYLYYRDRDLLDDLRQFAILLGLMLLTLTIAWVVSLNVRMASRRSFRS